MKQERLHVKLYGGVQGVGFRAFTRAAARKHVVYGYVRNCSDGAVEVEAAGEAAALESFRAALVQGPRFARVDRVEELPATDHDLGSSFEVVY